MFLFSVIITSNFLCTNRSDSSSSGVRQCVHCGLMLFILHPGPLLALHTAWQAA